MADFPQPDQRFQALLEAAPDAILELDGLGRITLVNRAVEQITGYGRGELLGNTVEMLVPAEVRKRHVAHRADFWQKPYTRMMGSGLDLTIERKDGTQVPVEIALSPVEYDGGRHVTAIIRDTSQRRAAEERIREIDTRFRAELTAKNHELEQRNREVERANRLKTEFVASMSHELRTPLHTIIGFAEILLEELDGPLNEKQKRGVQFIHKDSLHLLDLINDVLDLSRIEAGRVELQPETFHLGEATEEVLSTIRPQAAGKSIELTAVIPDETWLHADRSRFKGILLNLLSNAVKFTPGQGKIRVSGTVKGGWVEVVVADTGIGIAEEEQAAVFDKFYQVRSVSKGGKEGTGLGLAITKQLVEMHHGRIWVESRLGEGSRFHFTMPADETASETL